jgi:hypothetical protein
MEERRWDDSTRLTSDVDHEAFKEALGKLRTVEDVMSADTRGLFNKSVTAHAPGSSVTIAADGAVYVDGRPVEIHERAGTQYYVAPDGSWRRVPLVDSKERS